MKVKRVTFEGLGKKGTVIVTTNYIKANKLAEVNLKGGDNDLEVEIFENKECCHSIPFKSFKNVEFVR